MSKYVFDNSECTKEKKGKTNLSNGPKLAFESIIIGLTKTFLSCLS